MSILDRPEQAVDAIVTSDALQGTHSSSQVTTARLRGIRESAFRDAIVQYATLRGWLVMWTWNSKHSPAGWPDLFMARDGRIVVAELKVGKNTPTTAQWAWLEALGENAGIETYVWYPSDWDAIEEVLA